MKKSLAMLVLLTLTAVTPSFGQGFLLKPLIGPYQRPEVGVQTLRTAPTVSPSFSALVQNGGLPLSVNDMVRLTLENNFSLAINRFSPILSEYSIIQAMSSFDPSLNLRAQVNRRTSASLNLTEGAAVPSSLGGTYGATLNQRLKTGTSYSVGLSMNRSSSNNSLTTFNPSWNASLNYSITQPLLQGFGTRVNTASIVIAQNNQEISEIAFEQQVMDLVLQATNNYWDLVSAIETIDVRENALELAETTLSENERKVEIGTMPAIDLAQSRNEVQNQRLQLLTSQNSRRLVEDGIKTMISRVADPGLVLISLNPIDTIEGREDAILPVEEAIQMAYRNRPDMRQYDLDMENSELNLLTARNNLLPQLDLSVSYNQSGVGGTQIVRSGFGGDIIDVIPGGLGDAFSDIFGFNFTGYTVGFNLNIPLSNRNARAGYERQLITQRQTESRREIAMQSIALEVRNAYNQIELNRQQIEVALAARDLAQISLDGEQRKYELGASQIRFVIQEQNNLTSSELSLLNARINYLKSVAAYNRAIGRTLELNNVRIEDEYLPNLASETAPGVAATQP